MYVSMQDILLVAGFCIAMSVFPIVLQYSLSIRETKWFGWILPIVVFLISLNATYASYCSTVEEGANMWRVVRVFVLFNLLTAALISVYRFCKTVESRREKRADRKKVEQAKRDEKDAAKETIHLN